MKLKNIPWAKIAVASALMISAAAQAVPLQFTITGGYSASWTMDSNLVPDQPIVGSFAYFYDVPGTFAGASTPVVDLIFYNASLLGGLQISDYNGGGTSLLTADGPQLYTGTEDAPVFHTGVFAMTQSSGTTAYTLTVSSVPEPATVMSMLAGLGLVGVALRRRKTGAPTVG